MALFTAVQLMLLLLVFAGCSGAGSPQSPERTKIEVEDGGKAGNQLRKLKETEIELERNDKIYIVMDFKKQKIFIKMKGYILKDLNMAVLSDQNRLENFLSAVREEGGGGFRLKGIHIFRGIRMVGELETMAVTKALNADYDDVQRYSPLDMSISLDPGLIIRIESDGEGDGQDFFGNMKESATLYFRRMTGSKEVELKLKTEDSMALYGACKDRLPVVLIIPMT